MGATMEPSHRFQNSLAPAEELTSTFQLFSNWAPVEPGNIGLSCSFEDVDTLVSTFTAPRDLLSSVALSAESSDNSTVANDALQITPNIRALTNAHDPRPMRSRSYSETMWTVQKPRVRELYLQQGKTLKEVMVEMEQRYGFKATEKMYKSKITSWGFDKKHKLHEIQAIMRKWAQRSAAGKHTTFYLRGRPVDLDNAKRYLKRKRRSTTADSLRSVPTPPDLVCLSVPASPQTPEKFRPLEVIFTHYRNYVSGALDCGLWINESDDQRLYSTKESHGFVNDLFNFCASSFELLNRGFFAEAGKLVRRTAICLEEAVVSEDPYLLRDLVLALETFQFTKYQHVLDILYEHGANLAAKFLAESHPLRYICAALRSDPVLGTEDSIAGLLEGMCITLQDLLGGQNINIIELEFRVIQRRCQRQKLDNTKWQLQQIKYRIEQTCGSGNTRRLNALLHMANIFSLCSEYSEAKETVYEALKILEDESTFSPRDKLFRCAALRTLSYCLYDRGDLILAEETLRESTESALSVRGLESEALFSYEILETWLREWGRLQEADEVRVLHSKLVDELHPEDDILIN